MFESMWSSMSNSMQLAQECMKQDALNSVDSAQPLEGIERFAQMIESSTQKKCLILFHLIPFRISVLSRVRVKFFDIVIQVEHVPQDSSTGVGIIINIDQ